MIKFFKEELTNLCYAVKSTPSNKMFMKLLFSDSFIIMMCFRLRECFKEFHIPVLGKFLRLFQMGVYGIELGKDINIGRGVFFVHSLGIVVGGNARVGNRVRFMGNNTVGTAKDNGYPTIEDDVEIGCGARILGPITIGKGAKIGANAVVLKDVPQGAVAVGIPAKVISFSEVTAPEEIHSVEKYPLSKNLEELWINLMNMPWSSMALVTTHDSEKTLELAKKMEHVSRNSNSQTVTVVDARNIQMTSIDAYKNRLAQVDAQHKTIFVCPSPTAEPAALSIINSVDRAVLCVEKNITPLSVINKITNQIGQENIFGCIHLN